jgi:dipeptidase D
MSNVRDLHPKNVWNNFADLNAVPRPSKKEEKVIQFLKEFGEKLNLETIVDEVGNIVIKKPGTSGFENKPTVVLQGHMDMVPQKNADVDHDFEKDGIEMYIDGDWVKARGTTLGADNGIGVASAMTVLASTDIPHPPIEALFTVDEETGLTGAQAFKGGVLSGANLLNLDSEDDDEVTIGCAGGVDITGEGDYQEEVLSDGFVGYKLSVTGLSGGHSGIQISLGRGNSNKIMNRLLYNGSKKFSIRIANIKGGSLRNAIPRESFSEVQVPTNFSSDFENFITNEGATIKHEFKTTDPELEISIEKSSVSTSVINKDFQNKFLHAIYACPNGVYRMSPDIEGLIQTSNNLAKIKVENGKFLVHSLTRSAIDTEKMDFAQSIVSTFALADIKIELSGAYPGWIPKPEAPIVKLMSNIYKELFNQDVKVTATHGGLECGIIGKNYPDMDMISFGPNITGPHSPDEQVQISSVQKFWKLLLEVLVQI